MRKSLSLLAFVVLGVAMMYGQASRTWVSGVGDDANPCSRTAPCKTWAGAISKTAAGGEIDALDPGGFGALTITKAITLDGGGGQVASVLVSGTNGIVIQAGAGDVVIIRNLRINGIGSGLSGVQFRAGKDLNIENCVIFGFLNNGLDITLSQASQASVHVLNSVFKNNAGVGIRAANSVTPPVQVVVDGSAVILDNIGIEAAQHSRVAVSNSVISRAAADGLKADDSVSTDAQLTVNHSEISYNVNGATASTAGAFVSVGNSKIEFNSSCGLNNTAGGTNVFSFQIGGNGSNHGAGNGSNTCGSVTPLAPF